VCTFIDSYTLIASPRCPHCLETILNKTLAGAAVWLLGRRRHLVLCFVDIVVTRSSARAELRRVPVHPVVIAATPGACSRAPAATLHICTVLSKLADTFFSPSGLNPADVTTYL
jgi:hypothetical protein